MGRMANKLQKQKHAKQAAVHLRKQFKDSFWRSYYRNIEPKIVKK